MIWCLFMQPSIATNVFKSLFESRIFIFSFRIQETIIKNNPCGNSDYIGQLFFLGSRHAPSKWLIRKVSEEHSRSTKEDSSHVLPIKHLVFPQNVMDILLKDPHGRESHIWTVTEKTGILTGTPCRAPRRLMSNPMCPPLNETSRSFRSSVRDGRGCICSVTSVTTSIASSISTDQLVSIKVLEMGHNL